MTETEKFYAILKNMTGCDDCPYNAHGMIAKGWRDGADHLVGPCGQQNCWLELSNE